MIRLVLLAMMAAALFGQDTRTVTEPKIPPSCTALTSDRQVVDEAKSDTARIQQALDQCMPGRAVELKGGAFLSGPLQLRRGVTLLVDRGATLYGSRNPRDYDTMPGSCGVVNRAGRGCKPLISGDGVADAGVMGDGVIDGRGGEKLIGQDVSWWDLAQDAKVRNLNQNCPRLMQLTRSDNFTLYRITLKNSANFHVSYNQGNGFTAWGVIIDSPKTARNTDGIDPGNSTNVTITHCFIHTGDDQVAIKAGGTVPATHMTIAHNHFYTGHGISIGSETDAGASAIRVSDLSIDGADNGIRIKSNISRGGAVRDVEYSDVCIRDTKNPIYMDSNYTASTGPARDKFPTFQGIVLRSVRVLTSGAITLDGLDAEHRLGITFDNVWLDQAPSKLVAHYADVRAASINWDPFGESVAVEKIKPSGELNSCQGKFVPLPVK